jgi:hypothetical protein
MLELPLSVMVGKKKKFILNLNNYRGTHYRILTNAKNNYKDLIWDLIPHERYDYPVELIYTYYHGSNRRIDISNTCSIIDKFTCDVLTEKKVIPDDNTNHVRRVSYVWGGVDAKNPRCELFIKKL